MASEKVWTSAYHAGVDALGRDDLGAAREHFAKAIDLGADQWEPYYGRAWTLLRDEDGQPDPAVRAAAEADLVRALDEFGAGSDAAALLGHLQHLHGDYERAVGSLLRAIGRSTHQELVANSLTDALSRLLAGLEQEPTAEAVATCDRLARLVDVAPLPGGLGRYLSAEVLATRAYLHQELGLPEQGATDLRRVRALLPRHPRLPAEGDVEASGPGPLPGPGPTEPTFAQVGGADEPGTFTGRLRQRIFETYFGDLDSEGLADRLARYHQSPSRSLLLFGPSGCGKTFLIRAFSGEYRRRHGRPLPIFRMRLNDVLNRYVGDDEKRISEIFDQAIDAQPAILFGDEIDSIGMSREGGQDWRVQLTSHLLQEIDRLRESQAAVIFFGCTNRLWAMDLALLRRFDEMVPVELPDEQIRAKIFQVHLDQLDIGVRADDIDVAELARRSHGLAPGDIQKVVSDTVMGVISATGPQGPTDRLTQRQLLAALETYQQPMHIRDWVRQSVSALRELGHDDMARDVERTYGHFIQGGVASLLPGTGPAWHPVSEQAWSEEPVVDLTLLRQLRR
ncbi:AAA family ATPase [Micromonospora rifamycinica]|uniref:AAA family ATPase n=1 Tax=Micromonospora rifamycinica TaxID=291594 RepID=UPI0033FE7066